MIQITQLKFKELVINHNLQSLKEIDNKIGYIEPINDKLMIIEEITHWGSKYYLIKEK